MMKIHYLTSNRAKFDEAAFTLGLQDLKNRGISLVHSPLELDEIQGTSLTIAKHKIEQGYAKLHEPCVIDDVSLSCPSLGGLPGPYIRSFLEALEDKGVAELVHHYPDKSCTVTCYIAFAHGENEFLVFVGTTPGTIVLPRGTRKPSPINWNAIFQPDGSDRTFAEMSLEEASHFSARVKALTLFREFLLSKKLNCPLKT
jgi:inosine triphosphate pyrophosphatase